MCQALLYTMLAKWIAPGEAHHHHNHRTARDLLLYFVSAHRMIHVVPVPAQGNDYMVPFSPDRSVAAPPNGGPEDPTRGTSEVTTVTSEIAPVPATNVEIGEANEAAEPGPTGASTPGDSSVADGVGGSISGMKEFCFSEDDDDTEGEEQLCDKDLDSVKPKGHSGGEGLDDGQAKSEQGERKPSGAAGPTSGSTEKSTEVGGREEKQKRARSGRRRRQRPKDGDSGSNGPDDLSSDSDSDSGVGSESAAERKRRQDHIEALLNPLGLPHGGRKEGVESNGNRTPPTGGKRGIVDSACATPAPGAWAAPNFGFSSDDDFDIEFSASERSLERSVERSWSRSPRIEEDEEEEDEEDEEEEEASK